MELLGRRLSLKERLSTFERAIQNGDSLAVQCILLGDSERAIERGKDPLIPDAELPKLKTLWLEKVDACAVNKTLLSHQSLMRILSVWLHWGADDSKIKNWCAEVTVSDEGMFDFIKKFIYVVERIGGDEVKKTYHIDPKSMENYIDVADFQSRIRRLQAANKIPQEYEETANLFLQGVALWREGKAPEDVF